MRAQAELDRTDAQAQVRSRSRSRSWPWSRKAPSHQTLRRAALVLAVLLFVASLTAYLADVAAHTSLVLDWYDLNVYNDAGLITRQLPSILYVWELKVGVQFTYTPFAAIVFAGGSLLPLVVLRWTMTVASLIAVPLTAWLTLGAMGRRGPARAGVALAVAAVSLWIEPVIKALFLGQIELVLMLLIVWDLTRQDKRWWKGAGIGLAAGIKLVPLIFIPYLLLSGKFRQAGVAAAAFATTVVIGFAVLPGPSASYWLTGYFTQPGRTGGVDSLVNQSLLGAIARQLHIHQAQLVWLPIAITVAAVGVAAGAMLTRAGHAVPGWTLVGITAVLVSPISWDHHWVWIIPVLAMLAGLAMTSRGLTRASCIAGVVLTAGLIGSWPWNWSGPDAFVPRRGLLGWFVKPPQVTQVTALHGWKLLSWNLFVAVGCVIFLALVAWTWPLWRRRPRQPVQARRSDSDGRVPVQTGPALVQTGHAPVQTGQLPVQTAQVPAQTGHAPVQPGHSDPVGRPSNPIGRPSNPIGILLAKTDALLKGARRPAGPPPPDPRKPQD